MRGFFPDENKRNSLTMGLANPGVVADEDWYRKNRYGYQNGDEARMSYLPSTYCTLPATPEQVEHFTDVWDAWSESPGMFSPFGANCASAAGQSFAEAGVTDQSLPGLDTPENLYQHLLAEFGDDLQCQSGYVDQVKNADGTYDYVVASATDFGGEDRSTMTPGSLVDGGMCTTDVLARGVSQ